MGTLYMYSKAAKGHGLQGLGPGGGQQTSAMGTPVDQNNLNLGLLNLSLSLLSTQLIPASSNSPLGLGC